MKSIIFNTEMVKAILDGRKTQFRQHSGNYIAEDGRYEGFRNKDVELVNGRIEIHTTLARKIKSKYKVGDILYVKETFCFDEDGFPVFKAGFIFSPFFDGIPPKWKPSTHLKKEDARIFLKVTNVRVERLQHIDNDGIFADGFKLYSKNILLGSLKNKTLSKLNDDVKDWWINLWNSTAKNGYKWEDNPYVFVYEFKRVD